MSKFDAREYVKSKYNKNDDKDKKQKTTQKTKTTLSARDYVKEKYRKQKAEELGLDTLETDLNSLGTTIQGIYGGWQTEETMRNTRSSIESMYNRLTSYQDYRKTYGITEGDDKINDLVNAYKTTLDDWDGMSAYYGEFKNADAYNKAEQAKAKDKKRKQDAAKADLNVVQSEISSLESIFKKATEYTNKINKYDTANNAAQRYSGRNGFVYNANNDNTKNKNATQKELDKFLKGAGYSSVEELEAALKDKQSFLEEAKAIQEKNYFTERAWTGYGISGYEKYLEDEYKRKENAKANQPSAFEEGVMRSFTTSSDNPLSTIINNVIYDKRKDDSYQRPNSEWSQEAKYEFGARYLENPVKAYEWAAEYNNSLAEEKKNATKSKVNEGSTNGWSAVGNWIGARLTAPLGLADYLDDLTDIAAGRDTIVQEGVLTPFEYSQTVGESQASALNDWSGTLPDYIPIIGGKGVGDAYGLFNSIVDSRLSARAFGAAGTLVNYFGQSAASSVDDAVSRGADGKQALAYGTASGFAEAIPEMLSAKSYLKLKDAKDIGFWGKLNKQGLEEMKEEGVTSIMTNAADNAIMGEKSQFNIDVRNLMLKGLTKEEATRQVWYNKANDIGFDALGGYISGAGGSVGMAAAATKHEKYIRENYGESAEDLIAEGLEGNKDSEAYKLATEAKQKIDSGKTLTTEELSQLVSANTDAYQEEISADAKKRLSKLGSTDDNSALAKIIAKKTSGVGLTKSETKALQNSQYGNRVFNEINYEDLAAYTENMSESDADLFLSQYDGKSNVDAYAKSFNLVSDLSANDWSQDYILEHKGALSNSQVNAIYKANVLDVDKKLQKTLDSLKTKHKNAKFIKGNFDDSVIDYTNSVVGDVETPNGSKVRWNDLNDNQKKAVATLGEFFSGLGLDVTLISDGLERGINGAFSVNGNRVLLDVYAGIDKINAKDLRDTIVPTASHETVHWAKNLSPEIYRKLDRFAFNSLMDGTSKTEADILSERRRLMEKAHPGVNYTDAEVREEVIARACEDMLVNTEMFKKCCESMTESERKTFIDKIKEIIQNIKGWIDEFISKQKSQSPEAKKIREDMARFKEQVKLFEEMLEDAALTNQALKHEGISGKEFADKYLATKELKYNERLVERHFDLLEKNYSEESTLPLETLIERYNKVVDMWKKLGGELNSSFLEDWNNKLGTDRTFSVFKAQAGYKYNVELSSMCKKGIPLFEAIDRIVKEEAMNELNTKTLGKAEKEILYDILKTKGFEIPCSICYVEQARQREGAIIDAFLNGKVEKTASGKVTQFKLGWNETLKAIQDEMKAAGFDYTFPSVDRSIATDNYSPADLSMDEETQKHFFDALKTVANKEIRRYNKENNKSRKLITKTDAKSINEVFKGKLPLNLSMFKVLFKEPSSRFVINDDLLYSSMTTQNLAAAHNGLYSLFNSQGGVGGYKTKQGTIVYWADILNKKWTPEDLRKEGGIRNQSNSDFLMYTLLDHAQMYIDFTAKGYYLQAYTKVLAELKLFGLSKGKINASFIPKVELYYNADGTVDVEKTRENAGLDKNGNPIYDDIEGINHEEAFMLVEDAEYSKSIGGVCIGYSDKHISKLLDDNRIQLIIGFHDKTNDTSKRYKGAVYAKNYNGLNEATKLDKDGTLKTVHIGFNKFVKSAEGKFKGGKESIEYKGKTYKYNDIPRLATDLYLEHCESKGLFPAYSQGGTDFSKHPNYYKLLADFSLYDINGNYAPHQKVEFNMPDQVPYLDKNGKKAYMSTEDYVKAELKKELTVRDDISEKLSDKSEDGIIPEFVKRVNALYDNKQVKNSDRDSDYMEAVNRDDMEMAKKLVYEVAKEKGYTQRLFHGTADFGYTKFEGTEGHSYDEIQYFATDSLETATTYSMGEGVRRISSAQGVDLAAEAKKHANDMASFMTKEIGDDNYIDSDTIMKAAAEEDFGAIRKICAQWLNDVYEAKYSKEYKNKFFKRYKNQEDFKSSDKGRQLKKEILKLQRLVKDSYDSRGLGTYEFYANTDNLFVLDGKGKNWDALEDSRLPENRQYKTREVCEWAKAQGYSGVLFKNIVDSGLKGADISAANVYAFFNPREQVKSADPVTYDNDGNVIPLSERFNKNNDDMRYSDRDTTYMDAVNRGDMETAQRMVDEAAKEAGAYVDSKGNVVKILHGTNMNFNSFDAEMTLPGTFGYGHYFSSSQSTSNSYGKRSISAYLMTNRIAEKGNHTIAANQVKEFLAAYDREERNTTMYYADSTEEWLKGRDDLKVIKDLHHWALEFENGKTIADVLNDTVNILGVDAMHRDGINYWVVYDNKLVKSTDPVTYDDNGNVIPLSQRFNKENDDIRYSDREKPNIDKKRVLRDNESRANKQGDFINEFYPALSRQEWAAFYTELNTPTYLEGKVGTMFTMKLGSKFVVAERVYMGGNKNDYVVQEVLRIEGDYYDQDVLTTIQDELEKGELDYDRQTMRKEILRILESNQSTGVLTTFDGERQQYVRVSSKRVKGNGNGQIYGDGKEGAFGEGLSLRDKPSVQGTDGLLKQNSDRIEESVYDKMGETARLVKENAKLKEDVDRLKERLKIERQVTHGNFFNENQLNAVAGHIRNIADSNYDKKELVKSINSIYQYIAHSPDLNWEDLYSQCYDVADKVLDKSRPITETNPYYQDIVDDIRKTKISVNEQQIQNAKYRLGNRWRNSFFNKVTISDNGISLDSQWQEWSSMYPNIFDAELSDADQLVELLDIYDSVRQASETVVEYDKEERTRWLAREIYNQYWNVSTIRTTADKYDKQIKRLNFEHRKAMQEFRDDYDAKLKEQHRIDKQKAQELVKDIRERKDREIAEVKQKSKERMNAYKENAEKKTKIQSITSNALTLNKWLKENSKDHHINETLKPVVVNLLQAIDFSSKQMLNKNIPTQKDISLYKALQDVKNMFANANNETALSDLTELYGLDMDEDITTMLDSAFTTLTSLGDNGYILNKMNLDELNTLNKVVKSIKQVVTKLNKFHIANHFKGVTNLSQNSIVYFDKLGQAKVYDPSKLKGKVAKLLNWSNATPYYAFKRFGDGGKVMFEALQDGQDKLAFNIKSIINHSNKTYTNKEVRNWSEEVKSIKVRDMITNKDVTVQITVAQAMSLYCSLKREQAQGHILGDGIRITDITTKKGKVISQAEGVKLSVDDLSALTGILTDRQIQVADKLQEFMNTICTEWGNEISMARFGYKAFGEPNYFPISSDKNNLAVDDAKEESNSLFRLLNMSFTKSVKEGASNKVEIKNIFDVFAQHSSDMAKYNAFALPILDFYKWYNYTEKGMVNGENRTVASLKASMEKAFGKDAKEYVTTFLKDINGQYDVSSDTLGKGFFKNAKIAAVGMNLRVVLLQPTSYFRASAVIDNKYLAKALLHKPKVSKATERCGMALWKSLGYYDTNIQRGVTDQIKHNETWKDKAVEVSMKGAEIADKITLGYLWNACELEIRDTRKDLQVGSPKFNDAIIKRLRDVIYATQVVDSTMTRSQMMRSQGMYDKMLTSFASEPTLAYNMVVDAFETARLEKRADGKISGNSVKKIARVVAAYTITNAVAALVESGFDAFRDEDDEEMDLTEFMKLYFTNFAFDMSLTAKIPYVKEFVSIMQGFTSSRTDTQWMQSLGYALKGWYKVLAGDGKPVSALKNSLRSLSYLSGMPFYNAYRDTMALLDKLDVLTAEEIEEWLEDLFS